MEDDEKEMLSEARARLANTQGKKAKRKAREKQLEESRRLAGLQKRRELKAAGIEIKIQSSKKNKNPGMNYNADIPFYHEQPAGFFDINDEIARETLEKRDVVNSLLSSLDGKRRVEMEENERRKDFKRQKTKKEAGDSLPDAVKAAASANILQVSARKGLVLPAPQVSEQELQKLVKLGVSGEAARTLLESGNETPANFLLGNQSSIPSRIPTRTPRIASNIDSLKQEARNMRAMDEAQTPLLGQSLEIEGNVDFAATPKLNVATPNLIAGRMTPSSAFGRSGTPMRDIMGINTPRSQSGFQETPREIQQEVIDTRAQLESMFKSLPKPKNDFEIVLPNLDSESDYIGSIHGELVQDTEEVVADRIKFAKIEQALAFSRRSQVIQLGLPRPVLQVHVIEQLYKPESTLVEDLVSTEMAVLLHYDASTNPLPNQSSLAPLGVNFQNLTDLALAQASDLIQEEIEAFPADIEVDSVFSLLPKYGFVPSSSPKQAAKFVVMTKMTALETRDMQKYEMKALQGLMKKSAGKSMRLEKKLLISHTGYMSRSRALDLTLLEESNSLIGLNTDLEEFERVSAVEKGVCEDRIEEASKFLEGNRYCEQDLQDEYRDLVEQLKRLRGNQ